LKSFRRTLVAGAAAVILVGVALALDASSHNSAPGSSASDCATGSLGVYAGPEAVRGVEEFGRLIGCRPAYAMDFVAGTSWQSIEAPGAQLSKWRYSGYRMTWGVPILPDSYTPNSNAADSGGSAFGLAQGAAGDFDSHFVTLAKALVAGGQGSAIIRLGWEFNGGWFPWAANGSAANFVAYWRNIVTAMRSVSGQDFSFEWNPTTGDLGVGNLADYYPGNPYVDYIGLDVYDQNWLTYPGAAKEFSTLEAEPYGLNWLASFAAQEGKPITLPEWGLGSGPGDDGNPIAEANEEVAGGDDPTFINDMAEWIRAHHVYEATFYDVGQSAIDATRNPDSLAALRAQNQPGPTHDR
jgi:hypothetical protein